MSITIFKTLGLGCIESHFGFMTNPESTSLWNSPPRSLALPLSAVGSQTETGKSHCRSNRLSGRRRRPRKLLESPVPVAYIGSHDLAPIGLSADRPARIQNSPFAEKEAE